MIFKSAQVRIKINKRMSIPRDMESNMKERCTPIWISTPAATHSRVINTLKKLILTIDHSHRTTADSRAMVKQKENSKKNSKSTLILIIWWIIIHRFQDSQIYQGIRFDLEKMLNLRMILLPILKRKIIKTWKMILILFMEEIKEVNVSKVRIDLKLNLQTMLNRATLYIPNQNSMPIVFTINQIQIQQWKERTITQLKSKFLEMT